ncbi:MAG: hypothetical protein AB1758_06325, partial [Candidatus Eremiobacterota bacterium]
DAAPTPDAPVADNTPARPPVALRSEIDKDPFVNPLTTKLSPRVPPRPDRTPPRHTANGGTTPPKAKDAAAAEVEKEPVPEPEFRVTGLVASGAGRRAIVSWDGESRIVSTGQAVGDYRVTAIHDRSITVVRDGQRFQVKMASEFARP